MPEALLYAFIKIEQAGLDIRLHVNKVKTTYMVATSVPETKITSKAMEIGSCNFEISYLDPKIKTENSNDDKTRP